MLRARGSRLRRALLQAAGTFVLVQGSAVSFAKLLSQHSEGNGDSVLSFLFVCLFVHLYSPDYQEPFL